MDPKSQDHNEDAAELSAPVSQPAAADASQEAQPATEETVPGEQKVPVQESEQSEVEGGDDAPEKQGVGAGDQEDSEVVPAAEEQELSADGLHQDEDEAGGAAQPAAGTDNTAATTVTGAAHSPASQTVSAHPGRGKLIAGVAVLVVLVLIGLGGVLYKVGVFSSSSPESVVRTYVEGTLDKDASKVCSTLSERDRETVVKRMQAQIKMMSPAVRKQLGIKTEDCEGLVSASLKNVPKDPSAPKKEDLRYKTDKTGNDKAFVQMWNKKKLTTAFAVKKVDGQWVLDINGDVSGYMSKHANDKF